MRRAFRNVLAIVKWVAIAVTAVVLVVIGINLHDQDLTPEAKSLAAFHSSPVPEPQNLYLALVGFDAPAGADPVAAGARIVAENNAAAENDPSGRERAAQFASGGPAARREDRLKFIGAWNVLSDPLDKPCLPEALAHASDIRAMTDANAELVARYRAMQTLPAFADTSLPDIVYMSLPSGGWNTTQRLLLMRAALDAQSGRVGPALEFLAADIGMWRRVLGSGGALVDELIATRVLATDFRVLSDLLAVRTFDVRANEAQLRQIVVPLSPAELDMAPMFKSEFEMPASMIRALPEEMAKGGSRPWIDRLMDGSLFSPLLFKPNASLNLSARLHSGLQILASHRPSEFAHLRDKMQAENRVMSEWGITWIYNPIGRTIVGIGASFYPDYIARVFDLAAYVRLVRAQLETRLAGVAPDQVPAFLTSAGPDTRNPYTERPFAWNAADNALSFEPMSTRWRKWPTKAVVVN